ncbi:ABC transporter permease [Paenibacillus taichungensis]
MKQYVKDLYKRKDLIGYLVTSGLKAQHRNSFLGYFWWLLDPLLSVLIYYFVVVMLFNRGGEGYGAYLIVGLVTWRWISTTISTASKAIVSRSNIITQIYMPKIIFPISTSLTQLINFGFGLIVIFLFLLILGVYPGYHLIYLPILILVSLLFLLFISSFISFFSVFIRDTSNILGHILKLLFYGTPVIWTPEFVPEQYLWITYYNPFATILDSFRDVLIYNHNPEWMPLLMISVISLVGITIILNYYKNNEYKIIKAL